VVVPAKPSMARLSGAPWRIRFAGPSKVWRGH
jgi:hypothetical protein